MENRRIDKIEGIERVKEILENCQESLEDYQNILDSLNSEECCKETPLYIRNCRKNVVKYLVNRVLVKVIKDLDFEDEMDKEIKKKLAAGEWIN